MNLAQLAVHRLLRSPRRSLQEIIGIGLVTSILIMWASLSGGFANTIYMMATRLILGQMQIHHPKFLTSESMYDAFTFTSEQAKALHDEQYAFTYRLYQYALASNQKSTKGVRIVGLDPQLEADTTDLATHLEKGRFLSEASRKEAVIGFHLARSLDLDLDGELIVLGTAADGSLASEVFKVVGILKPITQVIDYRYVYVGGDAFRELFAWPERIHELLLVKNTPGSRYAEPDPKSLGPLFPDAEIETWRQLNPHLSKVLDLLSYTVYITLGFVFIALGMLLLNLKLMSTFDRSREYGVMLALGMHPRQLVVLILWEALALALVAGALALTLGVPAALWIQERGMDFSFLIDHLAYSTLVMEPVIYGILSWKVVLAPMLFLFITLPLAALYPAIIASRIQPTEAIQGKGSGR